MDYKELNFKIPVESPTYKEDSDFVIKQILQILDLHKRNCDDDINYNPALGTGQIQIKDIHYVSYQYRTTWEMCKLLDSKYLHSSRRTINDFYREAVRNKWIK